MFTAPLCLAALVVTGCTGQLGSRDHSVCPPARPACPRWPSSCWAPPIRRAAGAPGEQTGSSGCPPPSEAAAGSWSQVLSQANSFPIVPWACGDGIILRYQKSYFYSITIVTAAKAGKSFAAPGKAVLVTGPDNHLDEEKGAGDSNGSEDQKDMHPGLSGPRTPASFILSFFKRNIICSFFFVPFLIFTQGNLK